MDRTSTDPSKSTNTTDSKSRKRNPAPASAKAPSGPSPARSLSAPSSRKNKAAPAAGASSTLRSSGSTPNRRGDSSASRRGGSNPGFAKSASSRHRPRGESPAPLDEPDDDGKYRRNEPSQRVLFDHETGTKTIFYSTNSRSAGTCLAPATAHLESSDPDTNAADADIDTESKKKSKRRSRRYRRSASTDSNPEEHDSAGDRSARGARHDATTLLAQIDKMETLLAEFQSPTYGSEEHPRVFEMRLKYVRASIAYVLLDFDGSVQRDMERKAWMTGVYPEIEQRRKSGEAEVDPYSLAQRATWIKRWEAFLNDAIDVYTTFLDRLDAHFGPLTIQSSFVMSWGRTLNYLGDLLRYKEMYTGDQATPVSKRCWAAAYQRYLEARFSAPQLGLYHNQLAIISFYTNRLIPAVYHYTFSLLAKEQYLPAKQSLLMLFQTNEKRIVVNAASERQSHLVISSEATLEQLLVHALFGVYTNKPGPTNLKAVELFIQKIYAVQHRYLDFTHTNTEFWLQLTVSILNIIHHHLIKYAGASRAEEVTAKLLNRLLIMALKRQLDAMKRYSNSGFIKADIILSSLIFRWLLQHVASNRTVFDAVMDSEAWKTVVDIYNIQAIELDNSSKAQPEHKTVALLEDSELESFDFLGFPEASKHSDWSDLRQHIRASMSLHEGATQRGASASAVAGLRAMRFTKLSLSILEHSNVYRMNPTTGLFMLEIESRDSELELSVPVVDAGDDPVEDDLELKALHSRHQQLHGRLNESTNRGGKRVSQNVHQSYSSIRHECILVLDTNCLVDNLDLVDSMASQHQCVMIVPLIVVAELDGLKASSSERVRLAATLAIEFLESIFPPFGSSSSADSRRQSLNRHLKKNIWLQTSQGNFLPDLRIRTENLGGSSSSSSSSGSSLGRSRFQPSTIRNNDDAILEVAKRTAQHLLPPHLPTTPLPFKQRKCVLLVTDDVNLRLKATPFLDSGIQACGMAEVKKAMDRRG
ncbi:uncharacterized protein BJ171DRAFT_505098 [Polychytrium aggregatum]|uniref:uncharacterized protein n=1 Tax=Polychytrium aggregatum TaxID=110093 RepID=UPI0022FE3E2D|nr:uncharacterized protein BJ171DRAFT_505098 [Polychytrium aggregatum]KAI9204688.1 hypothetical protein BJ171DRAFT_505098 [Polychytrium aggregatum]